MTTLIMKTSISPSTTMALSYRCVQPPRGNGGWQNRLGYGNMLSSLEMWHGSSMSHSKASLPFIVLEAVAFIAWMKGLTSAKQVKAGDPEQFLLQNRRSVRFARERQQNGTLTAWSAWRRHSRPRWKPRGRPAWRGRRRELAGLVAFPRVDFRVACAGSHAVRNDTAGAVLAVCNRRTAAARATALVAAIRIRVEGKQGMALAGGQGGNEQRHGCHPAHGLRISRGGRGAFRDPGVTARRWSGQALSLPALLSIPEGCVCPPGGC